MAYMVLLYDYEDQEIVGIFSTFERAEIVAQPFKNYLNGIDRKPIGDLGHFLSCTVMHITLDEILIPIAYELLLQDSLGE